MNGGSVIHLLRRVVLVKGFHHGMQEPEPGLHVRSILEHGGHHGEGLWPAFGELLF